MKKTSIYLEPELDRALTRRAAIEGVSKAELIRETRRRSVSDDRPRIPAVGIIEGPGDVADNVDRYLAEGFGRD